MELEAETEHEARRREHKNRRQTNPGNPEIRKHQKSRKPGNSEIRKQQKIWKSVNPGTLENRNRKTRESVNPEKAIPL
jgi:hypothetical protein